MATTTMVHVRIDGKIKEQAAETLASMGLTLSGAVRLFLTRVVADKELPFSLKAPKHGCELRSRCDRTKSQSSLCKG